MSLGSGRSIRVVGDSAVIVDCADLAEVVDLHRALAAAPLGGVVDIVPAARTVLVTIDRSVVSVARVQTWIETLDLVPRDTVDSLEAVTIDVVYDGEDLADVAELLGLTRRDVVDIHTSSAWHVAFTGFAPGFGYLVTDHDRLAVPRRSEPRTRVPAGSVALAGEFSGVYPRSSPGGWRLIGTTTQVLWDARGDPPALLAPGRAVRFREVS